jgi:integrase
MVPISEVPGIHTRGFIAPIVDMTKLCGRSLLAEVAARAMAEKFVVHSTRHTCLICPGKSGTDAFTIMKLAGHSSVTVSQRYVHPTPEAVERAFDRLEGLNRLALEAPSR